nr:aminotransferase class IV [Kibdelosporangium sp. MJ126-NF4]CEL22623.1 Aminodeoxychorismate lyase [Kibdelosporangium sp. MJ126-NF4]CTQ89765.1 Aminodeoxychorismate lyase (EC 4.1.3.38) [Kibdelosporangium sp. MJ126-NF4]
MGDIETIAFVNYGHYTSILVHPDGARGLTAHLERLDRDARIVFGHGIDGDVVRERIRAAIRGHDLPANVRVTAFTRNAAPNRMTGLQAPDVVVTARPVRPGSTSPLRVRSAVYSRYLPEVKHTATFSLFHQVRLAQEAGYDDVLFVDGDGRVAEGSFWNIAFHDGEKVVWPDAPALPGVEMALLRAGLRELGVADERREVRLAELPNFRSAFRTNAVTGPMPISSIDDDITYQPDPELTSLLDAARQAVPLEKL